LVCPQGQRHRNRRGPGNKRVHAESGIRVIQRNTSAVGRVRRGRSCRSRRAEARADRSGGEPTVRSARFWARAWPTASHPARSCTRRPQARGLRDRADSASAALAFRRASSALQHVFVPPDQHGERERSCVRRCARIKRANGAVLLGLDGSTSASPARAPVSGAAERVPATDEQHERRLFIANACIVGRVQKSCFVSLMGTPPFAPRRERPRA
jgi:hypothetical protein